MPSPADEADPAAGAGRSRVRHLALVVLRSAAVAAVVAVVAKVGADNYSSLRHVHLRIEPAWLVPAAVCSLSGGLLMPLGWRLLISAFGPTMSVGAALRIWWTAQITRYVPSGAAALATRVVLASREGVSRLLAGASLPMEVAVIVGWGAVLTGALLPDRLLPGWARAATAAAGGAGLVLLVPLLRLPAARLPRLPRLAPGRAGAAPLYGAEGLYGLNSAVRTGAALFLMAALVPVKPSDLALLAGAFNASAVAGLVSVAPGGLGVREGVLTLILKSRYGFGDAVAVSVALRAWDLGVDVVWLLVARVAGRRRPSDPAVVPPG